LPICAKVGNRRLGTPPKKTPGHARLPANVSLKLRGDRYARTANTYSSARNAPLRIDILDIIY